MLSNTAGYALRAVLVLARHYGDRPLRADEIAHATAAPHNYLAKTLNALAKSGIVSSSRGPNGGFTLSVDPFQLSLARVIDVFDEPRPHTRCLLGNRACNKDDPCAAHTRWNQITLEQRESFLDTTIADLLGTSQSSISTSRS